MVLRNKIGNKKSKRTQQPQGVTSFIKCKTNTTKEEISDRGRAPETKTFALARDPPGKKKEGGNDAHCYS